MSRRAPYEMKPIDAAPMFWRSLEEKADPGSFHERAESEFPEGQLTGADVVQKKSTRAVAADPDDVTPIGRRGFMMLAGASAALAGCARRPVEKILPYTRQPEF